MQAVDYNYQIVIYGHNYSNYSNHQKPSAGKGIGTAIQIPVMLAVLVLLIAGAFSSTPHLGEYCTVSFIANNVC